MKKELVKKLLPLIQAYADGKEMQIKELDGTWKTIGDLEFDGIRSVDELRVKPEYGLYRPFKDSKECVEAINKHGLLLQSKKLPNVYDTINTVKPVGIFFSSYCSKEPMLWEYAFENYQFSDGTVFGEMNEKYLVDKKYMRNETPIEVLEVQ